MFEVIKGFLGGIFGGGGGFPTPPMVPPVPAPSPVQGTTGASYGLITLIVTGFIGLLTILTLIVKK